jgi:hypothetical protein
MYEYSPQLASYSLLQIIPGSKTTGSALQLSATGQYLVVSDDFSRSDTIQVGSKFPLAISCLVYERQPTCSNTCTAQNLWQAQAKLYITQNGTVFPAGVSLNTLPSQYAAISGDGSTIALAWPTDFTNTVGMVAIFKRAGATWTQAQLITLSTAGSFNGPGNSVSLSQDGSYLAIGQASIVLDLVITVYIYRQQGSVYTQNTILSLSQFSEGISPIVSLSADGTVLAIGTGPEIGSGGIAIALRGPNNSWSVPFIRLPQGSEFRLGNSIACSADGNFVIAGAPGTNGGTGEAIVFRPAGSFIPNDAVITGSLCVYNQTTIDSTLKIAGNIHTNNTILTGTAGRVTACSAVISDKRVKENITRLNPHDALALIRALKPVTFDWINPKKHASSPQRSAGFIAQDIEEILPHWVSNDDTTIDDQPTKMLTIKPELYAYLVATLKRLVHKAEEQRKEMEQLNN